MTYIFGWEGRQVCKALQVSLKILNIKSDTPNFNELGNLLLGLSPFTDGAKGVKCY